MEKQSVRIRKKGGKDTSQQRRSWQECQRINQEKNLIRKKKVETSLTTKEINYRKQKKWQQKEQRSYSYLRELCSE